MSVWLCYAMGEVGMTHKPPAWHKTLIPRAQIQAYLFKRTGTLVSKRRIGDWIARGEIKQISVPCGGGYKWYTTRKYLDALIDRYRG